MHATRSSARCAANPAISAPCCASAAAWRAVVSCSSSTDGRHVLTLGYDGTVKTWSTASGALSWTFVGHRDAPWSVDIHPDGERFVTGGFDGTVRVWLGIHKTLDWVRIESDTSEMHDAALSPDGTMIATAQADGSVQLWDRQGSLIRTWSMPPRNEFDIMHVAWHPSGSRLLGSGGQAAVEWDVATGTETRVFKDQGPAMLHAIYAPDGERIATAGADGTVKLRDARTGAVTATLPHQGKPVRFMDFDATGESLITADKVHIIRLWQVATATEIRRLGAHRQEIRTVRLSPDGTRIVLAPRDKSAEIWSAETGALQVKLEGHDNEVNSAVFSPDSHLVATASDDRSVKLWDAASGTPLWTIDLQQAQGHSVEFSPDGRYLLGTTKRSARIWPAGYEQRSSRELRTFAACRVDFALRDERLERVELDYQSCFQR
jgi:WD40 repeat protein